MNTMKKLSLIALLAVAGNAFGWTYTVINNSSRALNKITLQTAGLQGDMPAFNLNPGGYAVYDPVNFGAGHLAGECLSPIEHLVVPVDPTTNRETQMIRAKVHYVSDATYDSLVSAIRGFVGSTVSLATDVGNIVLDAKGIEGADLKRIDDYFQNNFDSFTRFHAMNFCRPRTLEFVDRVDDQGNWVGVDILVSPSR